MGTHFTKSKSWQTSKVTFLSIFVVSYFHVYVVAAQAGAPVNADSVLNDLSSPNQSANSNKIVSLDRPFHNKPNIVVCNSEEASKQHSMHYTAFPDIMTL